MPRTQIVHLQVVGLFVVVVGVGTSEALKKNINYLSEEYLALTNALKALSLGLYMQKSLD